MKKILYILLALSTVALSCTKEKEKPEPKKSDPSKAPQVVATTPSANAPDAEVVDEIVITYDKAIILAPNTTISVNGVYYDEDVYVADKELCIPIEMRGGGITYTVKILSPSVKDADGNYAQDFSFSFTTLVRNNFDPTEFELAEAPVDANATAEAKALYAAMKENFGTKIYSATMADASGWDLDNAQAVHAMTGKYPAMHAFDYLHLKDSAPDAWIDYGDLTPVTTWAGQGGIVAASWHWAVPTSNPNSSIAEDNIEMDEVVMAGDWTSYKCLTKDVVSWGMDPDGAAAAAMASFAQCVVGSTVEISYKDATAEAQMGFRTHGWAALPGAEGDYDHFVIQEGSGSFILTLDAANLAEVKAEGFTISGCNYTLTGVVITHPKENGTVTVDFDDVEMGGWANSRSLTQDMVDWYSDAVSASAMAAFADLKVGGTITCYYKDAAADAQMAFKNHNWAALVGEDGTDYGFFSIPAGEGNYVFTMDATLLAEIKANGVIIGGQNYTLTYVEIANPAEPAEVEYSFYAQNNEFNPVDALSAKSWQKKVVDSSLAKLAGYLQQLQDQNIPVLFRPLHEASGGWFWWGTKTGEDFVDLWKYVYNYLTGAGIHNLLWVWTSCLDDADWYPGDEYVDFIAYDWYPQEEVDYHKSNRVAWDKLLAISNHKMLTLGECGPMPSVTECLEDGAMWSWWMPWYGVFMEEPYNSVADFKTWMAASTVIKMPEPEPNPDPEIE